MKMALFAGLITLLALLPAHGSEILLTEAKIWQMRAAIEAQAEQIKRAQEIIENRTGVSKARIEAQLRIAEEDLIIQREKLEIFRDQLAEQIQELDRAVDEIKTDWKSILKDTLDRVRSQIFENNDLVRRLRKLQERASFDGDGRLPGNGSVGNCAALKPLDLGSQCSAFVSGSALPGPDPGIAPTSGPPLSVANPQLGLAHLEPAATSPSLGTSIPVQPPVAVAPTG